MRYDKRMKKHISFWLPNSMITSLKVKAEEMGVSVSELLRVYAENVLNNTIVIDPEEMEIHLPEIDYGNNRSMRRRLVQRLLDAGLMQKEIADLTGLNIYAINRTVAAKKPNEKKLEARVSADAEKLLDRVADYRIEALEKCLEDEAAEVAELKHQMKLLSERNAKLERKLTYLRSTGRRVTKGKYKRILQRNQRLEARVKSLRVDVALLGRDLARARAKPTDPLENINGSSPSMCTCGGMLLVVDSRKKQGRNYRRRECDRCGRRVTTWEVVVEA
jgi:predicted transcriptional regulator